MINELKNKNLLHSNSNLYKKYFVQKIKDENELKKEEELSKLILNFYQKVYDDEETKCVNYSMFNYDFYKYGYLNDYGYYVIDYDSWGYYYINNYEDNIQKVFIALVKKILDKKGMEYEFKNHKELKRDFKNRFKNVKYFWTLPLAEYELDKWAKYFDGNIPEYIVKMYQDSLNQSYELSNNSYLLEYETESKRFIQTNNIKVRKRYK